MNNAIFSGFHRWINFVSYSYLINCPKIAKLKFQNVGDDIFQRGGIGEKEYSFRDETGGVQITVDQHLEAVIEMRAVGQHSEHTPSQSRIHIISKNFSKDQIFF